MNDPITLPWESEYTVEDTEILAETPELRVLRITLAQGQRVPLHFHTNVTDRITCIEGAISVDTRGPDAATPLAPGEEHVVPPKTAHQVVNKNAGRSRFLVIQGIGPYDYVAVGHP